MNLQTIIKNIQEIKKERTILTSSIYAQSELGELSDEVLKSINQSTKPGGEDGVFGEAIDVIICMLDIIQLDNPNITEEEILNKISQKVDNGATNQMMIVWIFIHQLVVKLYFMVSAVMIVTMNTLNLN